MDALFAPLASSLGASVDQVKASRFPGRIAMHRLTRQPSSPAHFLFPNCIPPWKPLHSDTHIPTYSQAYIQCHRFDFLLDTRPPSAIWGRPTLG